MHAALDPPLWTIVPNTALSPERTGNVAQSRHAARPSVSWRSEQAQRHKPASLSSESGESLRHVGCYPTVVGGEAG